MSRIQSTFKSLRERGEAAYIPYVCAGDPDIDFSLKLVERLCDSGADIIELGIPFSDPIADGPLIQEAMNRSLSNGFKRSDLLEMISHLRDIGIQQPVVVMSYYNTILNRGIRSFCEDLKEIGGDGMIAVDLPIEESSELDSACRRNEIDLISLVSPNTPMRRVDAILKTARGYIYLISVAGTTGPRRSLHESTLKILREIAARSTVPVALGFGISSPEHARIAVESGAGAVVEGSKLVAIYASCLNDRRLALEEVGKHARLMKSALRRNGF